MEEKQKEREALFGQAERWKIVSKKWYKIEHLLFVLSFAIMGAAFCICVAIGLFWGLRDRAGLSSEAVRAIMWGMGGGVLLSGVCYLGYYLSYKRAGPYFNDKQYSIQTAIDKVESEIMEIFCQEYTDQYTKLKAVVPPDSDTLRFDSRKPFELYYIWREADRFCLFPLPALNRYVKYEEYQRQPDLYIPRLSVLPAKELRFFELESDPGHVILLAPDGVWFCTSKEGWLILTDLLPKNVLAFDEVLGQLKRLQQLLDARQLSPQDFSRAKQALLAYARQVSPTFEPPETLSTCPYCGAPVQADSREKCVYCGRLL